MPYTSPRETLVVGASRSNSEALATRVMLAHPRATFHLCTCVLRRGIATIAAALISYDDHGGCCWDDQEEETIVIDYFFCYDV
jgi:hypothetical protein